MVIIVVVILEKYLNIFLAALGRYGSGWSRNSNLKARGTNTKHAQVLSALSDSENMHSVTVFCLERVT
jgi:hypothetical protein